MLSRAKNCLLKYSRSSLIEPTCSLCRTKSSKLIEWPLKLYRLLLPRFLPARRYASAGNRDRNVSVCLSVCPSVTRQYCIKTKKVSVRISSPSGSPMILVFRRQISSQNSKGIPRTGASNKVGSENSAIF